MAQPQPNDDARRAYWAASLDEAFDFILKMVEYPVTECGEQMVSLTQAADDARVEVEFSTKAHVNGLPRLYCLREGLIASFLSATREMNDRGWRLKVEDGYRTVEMQKHLARQDYTFDVVLRKVLWECNGTRPSVELLLRRMSALIANSPKVGTHMSGTAIDISVLDRDSHRPVDRGGPYLEMSELTPMDSPFPSPVAQSNRKVITTLMRQHGFVAYPWEFWHYNAGDAYAEYLNGSGQPARYGPVHLDLSDGSVFPIDEPTTLLNSNAEMQEQMERVLRTRSTSSS